MHFFSGSAACVALALTGGASTVGCGQQLDVGSDVLWTARFEGGDLGEWMKTSGGGTAAFPAPNAVDVSSDHAWRGKYAARFTLQTAGDGSQANAGLSRTGFLPIEAYYSAWYYLPSAVNISTFWVIFKFRMRSVADDASTAAELFDLNLANTSSGGMTLRLYDHRGGDVPLDVAEPPVPVGTWFQIEAYYLNPGNSTGRLALWLDDQKFVDITGPMAPTSWIAWDVVSVAVDLNPATAVLYVDDCAVSRTRVGPRGIISSSSN